MKSTHESVLFKHSVAMLYIADDRVTKKVFWYDRELCTNNWSSEMKALFNATEMGWIYDNMDQWTVSVFENKCMENLTERWLLGLSLKPKLRTYLLFKKDLSPEPYVKLCKSRRKRSILAQFRMGVLPLEIETGRFKNIQPEERYCVLCNQGLVEDEKHFLCTCKLYASIRNELFTNYNKGMPTPIIGIVMKYFVTSCQMNGN